MKAGRYGIVLLACLTTAFPGCTDSNPAYCASDADCTDPAYPACDTAIHACIPLQDGGNHSGATIWVDAEACPGPGSGTQADPFCKLSTALAQAGSDITTIRLGDGTYQEGQLSISRDIHLQGGEETVIEFTSDCPGVLILSGARVTIEGLSLRGNGGIRVTGGADAAILDNDIDTDACFGIECRGSTCHIVRNMIRGNPQGGISLTSTTFTVLNNIVAVNGTFGGVEINDAPPDSSFVNNTVADNNGWGVRCQAPVTIRNSILWQDASGELDGSCSLTHSNSSDPVLDNLSSDPLFVENYHIDLNSPCVGQADAYFAPQDDIDGLPRDGEPDIGADEAGED